MSEIKGQLLGMVLVLAVFALVGTTIYGAFASTKNTISDKLTEETTLISQMHG